MERIGFALAFLVVVIAPAWGADAVFQVGLSGWLFEHFGSDVAVLRAPVADAAASGRDVGLFLSCSGRDRRVRLSFPMPIATVLPQGAAGPLLVTSFGASGPRQGFAGRFTLTVSSTMTISAGTSTGADVVDRVGQLLLTRPRGLDVLVSIGSPPVVFTRLMVYRLAFSLGPPGEAAIRQFRASCGHGPSGRVE